MLMHSKSYAHRKVNDLHFGMEGVLYCKEKCFSLEKGKWVRIDEQNKKILGSGQFLKV
jgi:hypothetical protein